MVLFEVISGGQNCISIDAPSVKETHFSNIYPWCKAVPNISDFSPVEASHVNSSIYL